ncbi:unnamed protein product [Notodromas monacha]|uniref:MD-2-related lipid-recognition domain-containing protein n=1 Tax=Notodromas monacha TaxID=399045 RepID=A0A7R9GFQ1_9CRUS|nr:unnamed protein product [Notodromas monacha]CAG0920912.1 unnamed protein product [Notodromas monacha]
MKLLVAIAVVGVLGGLQAMQTQHLIKAASLTDCGGPNALLTFDQVTLSPDPVKYPGSINLELGVTVHSDIPQNAWVYMEFVKQGLIPISLPCLGETGACPFEFCPAVLTNQETFCTVLPTDENGNCSCPIVPGTYAPSGPISLEIPNFGSLVGALLAGNYKGLIELHAPGNRAEKYGCLDLSFRMEL